MSDSEERLCDWCNVCRGTYPINGGESTDCQAVSEPASCPNPHCVGGVIRGTAIGCAICKRPSAPHTQAARASVVLAVDPSWSTPDAVAVTPAANPQEDETDA